MSYSCACGHAATVKLSEFTHGKLVWKVDWPMRWAYEGVAFEPSGVDHTSPGSSYVVGGRIVGDVFGGRQPIGPMYAFVGMAGMAKMSSSKGGVPTPAQALGIMEAPLLRWLYSRKKPSPVDHRLVRPGAAADVRRVGRADRPGDGRHGPAGRGLRVQPRDGDGRGTASRHPGAAAVRHARVGLRRDDRPAGADCCASSATWRPTSPSSRSTCSGRASTGPPAGSPPSCRPSSGPRCGAHPTRPRSPRSTMQQRASVRMLLDGLAAAWSLDGLTTLVYGVPKRMLGLPLDVKPTPELRAAQRSVLRAALPAAGRPGHRPPAAHAAAGDRGRPGARAAGRRRGVMRAGGESGRISPMAL